MGGGGKKRSIRCFTIKWLQNVKLRYILFDDGVDKMNCTKEVKVQNEKVVTPLHDDVCYEFKMSGFVVSLMRKILAKYYKKLSKSLIIKWMNLRCLHLLPYYLVGKSTKVPIRWSN